MWAFICCLMRFYNDDETEFNESVFAMWPFYEWFNVGLK